MKKTRWLIPAPVVGSLVVALAMLAGCATQATRIRDHQAEYDAYPADVRSKIAAGQVDVGFTPEQVLLALGKPTRKFARTTTTGASEVWAYNQKAPGAPSFSFGIGGGFGLGNSGFGSVGASTQVPGDDASREDKLRVVFENGRVSAVEQLLQ